MDLFLECPHCHGGILVAHSELHCRIFRHGILRTGEPLDPHAPREVCERLLGVLLGCGKPFRVEHTVEGERAVVCEYI
jgi:hypothetical protein